MQKVCKKTSLNGYFLQDRANSENNLSITVAANQGGFRSA